MTTTSLTRMNVVADAHLPHVAMPRCLRLACAVTRTTSKTTVRPVGGDYGVRFSAVLENARTICAKRACQAPNPLHQQHATSVTQLRKCVPRTVAQRVTPLPLRAFLVGRRLRGARCQRTNCTGGAALEARQPACAHTVDAAQRTDRNL